MNQQELVLTKALVVLGCLLLLFIAEQLLPASPRPEGRKSGFPRWGRNLSLWGLNSLLSPAIVLPITVFGVSHGLGWRPDWLTGWSGLIADILLLDFWIYWWHRANHKVPLLWRFHRIHHLDQWLDTTSAVRFHFGEVLLSALVRAVVILCFGIPLMSVIAFETLVLLMAGFQHSNLRLSVRLESALSKVLITPSIHWVHHHVLRQDTDSNYGTILSYWDRLFGSQSANKRTNNMEIGLDDAEDARFFQLLLAPFKQR